MEYTAQDGKIYKTGFYNLDAIISVGYRVNSIQATQFRRWATERLKEYIKWQQNNLSPVEQVYLDTIKELGKRGKNKK